MPDDEKRYPALPLTVRRFLETLSDQDVVNIVDMADFYARLPRQSRDFLLQAKPETLQWLRDARQDEIEKLDRATQLANAAGVMAGVIKWGMATFLGALIFASQAGDAITNILAWFKR
jgi:hypothetical protein